MGRRKKNQDQPIQDLHQDFSKADARTRQLLAIQMEPLVNKIVYQQSKVLKTEWDVLKSLGYEGLAIAMNQYDPKKSSMSFLQYAGFSILNTIRNGATLETNVVKMTSYMQDRIRKGMREGSTFNSVSISTLTSASEREGEDNDCHNKEIEHGTYVMPITNIFSEDPISLLIREVEKNCHPLDAECFFQYYGLPGYPEKTVLQIATEHQVTSGRISQRIKKVVEYVKNHEELRDALWSLVDENSGS